MCTGSTSCGQLRRKLEFFGHRDAACVWRKKDKKDKHRPHSETGGGCIMLLGCFSVPETENLIKVESIMKKEGYVKFLNKLHAVSS